MSSELAAASPGTSPDSLGALRTEIVEGVNKLTGGQRSVLFELEAPIRRRYVPTASSVSPQDAPGVEFPCDSFLIRWLRVNGIPLRVPDDAGVYEALTDVERTALTQLSVTACVPFVHQRQLVGWIGVSGTKLHLPLDAQSSAQISWAARLAEWQARESVYRETEARARAHRLSVAGELAANVLHEARNPLAVIRSTVQAIHTGAAPASDQPELLATVLAQVDTVNRVLLDLMALGRPRSEDIVTCDARAAIDAAVGVCAPHAALSDQRIEVAGAERLSVAVAADADAIRQVLLNVLLNACQASGTGARTRVQLTANRDDRGISTAVIAVVDEGAGIPADQLSRVFEPFYTTKTDGGGLGLSICREILERYGGSIQLVSTLGHGTTVTMTLPLAPDHGAHSDR